MKFPNNIMFTSLKLANYCESKYPKRVIEPSIYIAHDDFYYYTKTGFLRLCRNKKEIWCLGNKFPEIRMIRKR